MNAQNQKMTEKDAVEIARNPSSAKPSELREVYRTLRYSFKHKGLFEQFLKDIGTAPLSDKIKKDSDLQHSILSEALPAYKDLDDVRKLKDLYEEYDFFADESPYKNRVEQQVIKLLDRYSEVGIIDQEYFLDLVALAKNVDKNIATISNDPDEKIRLVGIVSAIMKEEEDFVVEHGLDSIVNMPGSALQKNNIAISQILSEQSKFTGLYKEKNDEIESFVSNLRLVDNLSKSRKSAMAADNFKEKDLHTEILELASDNAMYACLRDPNFASKSLVSQRMSFLDAKKDAAENAVFDLLGSQAELLKLSDDRDSLLARMANNKDGKGYIHSSVAISYLLKAKKDNIIKGRYVSEKTGVEKFYIDAQSKYESFAAKHPIYATGGKVLSNIALKIGAIAAAGLATGGVGALVLGSAFAVQATAKIRRVYLDSMHLEGSSITEYAGNHKLKTGVMAGSVVLSGVTAGVSISGIVGAAFTQSAVSEVSQEISSTMNEVFVARSLAGLGLGGVSSVSSYHELRASGKSHKEAMAMASISLAAVVAVTGYSDYMHNAAAEMVSGTTNEDQAPITGVNTETTIPAVGNVETQIPATDGNTDTTIPAVVNDTETSLKNVENRLDEVSSKVEELNEKVVDLEKKIDEASKVEEKAWYKFWEKEQKSSFDEVKALEETKEEIVKLETEQVELKAEQEKLNAELSSQSLENSHFKVTAKYPNSNLIPLDSESGLLEGEAYEKGAVRSLNSAKMLLDKDNISFAMDDKRADLDEVAKISGVSKERMLHLAGLSRLYFGSSEDIANYKGSEFDTYRDHYSIEFELKDGTTFSSTRETMLKIVMDCDESHFLTPEQKAIAVRHFNSYFEQNGKPIETEFNSKHLVYNDNVNRVSYLDCKGIVTRVHTGGGSHIDSTTTPNLDTTPKEGAEVIIKEVKVIEYRDCPETVPAVEERSSTLPPIVDEKIAEELVTKGSEVTKINTPEDADENDAKAMEKAELTPEVVRDAAADKIDGLYNKGKLVEVNPEMFKGSDKLSPLLDKYVGNPDETFLIDEEDGTRTLYTHQDSKLYQEVLNNKNIPHVDGKPCLTVHGKDCFFFNEVKNYEYFDARNNPSSPNYEPKGSVLEAVGSSNYGGQYSKTPDISR